jgi:hypothetical protein
MLNFPNNSVDGETYVAPNGVTYTFDGTKWIGKSIIAQLNNGSIVVNQNGTITFDGMYTLPAHDGQSGQALITNGQGTVSWQTVSGSGADTGLIRFSNNVIHTSQGQNIVINPGDDSDNKIVIPGPGNGGTFDLLLVNTEGNVTAQAGAAQWIFGPDGTFNLPQSSSEGNAIVQSPYNIRFNSNGNVLALGTDGSLTFPGGAVFNSGTDFISASGTYIELGSHNQQTWVGAEDNDAFIQTSYGNNNYQWTFDNTGNLTVPGNIIFPQGKLGVPNINGTTDAIRLYDFGNEGTQYNYAIGYEGSHIWFNVDQANNDSLGFKFYGGGTLAAKITTAGNLYARGIKFNDSTINSIGQYGPISTDIYNNTIGGQIISTEISVNMGSWANLMEYFNPPTPAAVTTTGTIAVDGTFDPGTPSSGTFDAYYEIYVNQVAIGTTEYVNGSDISGGLRLYAYTGPAIAFGTEIEGFFGWTNISPINTVTIVWADGTTSSVDNGIINNFYYNGYVRLNTSSNLTSKHFPIYVRSGNYSQGSITFSDSTVQTTAWTGILPNPTYSGSSNIGNVTPAALNLNNTGPSGQVETQLALINTAGGGGTGSAIDFFTYTDQGNGVPGARLQSIDDNNYSANFSISLKGTGNNGNNGLTPSWTFGSDQSLTFPDTSKIFGTTIGLGSTTFAAAPGVPLVLQSSVYDGSPNSWTFGTDGRLTMPNGGMIFDGITSTNIIGPNSSLGYGLSGKYVGLNLNTASSVASISTGALYTVISVTATWIASITVSSYTFDDTNTGLNFTATIDNIGQTITVVVNTGGNFPNNILPFVLIPNSAFGLGGTGNVQFNLTYQTLGGTAEYTFGYNENGNVLTLPGNAYILTYNNPELIATTLSLGSPGAVSLNYGTGYVQGDPSGLHIETLSNNSAYNWSFSNTGQLVFPDNTIQTTAWTGSTSTLINGSYTLSLASNGDLVVPISQYGTSQVFAATSSTTLFLGNSSHYIQIRGSDGALIFADSSVQTTAWTVVNTTVGSSQVLTTSDTMVRDFLTVRIQYAGNSNINVQLNYNNPANNATILANVLSNAGGAIGSYKPYGTGSTQAPNNTTWTNVTNSGLLGAQGDYVEVLLMDNSNYIIYRITAIVRDLGYSAGACSAMCTIERLK